MRRTPLHTVKGHAVTTTNGMEITSDDKIPDEKYLDLNLPGDQMFQRWLVDRIFHRREMTFERGDLPPITGFLTGIDSLAYSVSTTSTWPPRSSIIPRHVVTGIEETGRSLHELGDEYQRLIKKYTQALHGKCERFLIPARMVRSASDRPRQNSL